MLLLVSIGVLALSVGSLWLYQQIGTARDRRRCPPPGRLVDIGGRRLHVYEAGPPGGPTVVFESGIAASSVNWRVVQNRLSQFVHTCSYDRAGFGWSDPAPEQPTASTLMGDLARMMDAARLPPPYILVAHSFGGLIVRLFAARYPEKMAGLVLVDSLDPEEWMAPSAEQSHRLLRGVALSRRGARLASLGIVRASLAVLASGSRLLPKAVARASSGRGASLTERMVGQVRKMPPELWPSIRSHWSHPKAFSAMAGHLERLPESCAGISKLEDFGQLPLVVLTAADRTPERKEWQRCLASRSRQGRWVVVPESGHWIQLDQPDQVVEAVLEIVMKQSQSSQTAGPSEVA